MKYQTLQLQQKNRVAVIRLNRPEVRNAFNETAIAELAHMFVALGNDDHVRVIVLAAHGPAFCAGADLHWMQTMADYTHEENRADAALLADMLHIIYTCPKPVVAQVQGDCYAGGMGLVAVCDIVVAADTAHFCLSEVKIGLIPAAISPYVVKAMGEQASRRYFLSAERFSAQEATRIGFVHEVVQTRGAADALDVKTGEIVNALLAAGPNAVRQAKRLVRDVAGSQLTEGLIADTVDRIAAIRGSDEGREGIRAFLEKRKPSWLE